MTYKQNFKPKLLLLVGNLAIRYVDGIKDQTCEVDYTGDRKEILAALENFRMNGAVE